MVKKEILIELRMKYAISGMILYLVSSVFLGYITFNLGRVPINVPTWNVLFWIIMLFVATNSIAKSFIQILDGIYHNRIEYPDSPTAAAGKGKNGNSDRQQTKPADNSPGEDSIESPSRLKRLGQS